MSVCITGNVKANVLPEPVDAAITKFSPFNNLGITAFWTGVGVRKPERTCFKEELFFHYTFEVIFFPQSIIGTSNWIIESSRLITKYHRHQDNDSNEKQMSDYIN